MGIYFTIPGQPQGKARAITTKFGSYTPEKTVLYENLIKLCYREKSNYLSENPLTVFIWATYQPPKSVSNKQRVLMLSGHIKPTKKPDIDNIAKVVLDALNGIAYKDDTQIIKLVMEKSYGEVGEVRVLISEDGD